MITREEEEQFKDALVPDDLLGESVDWIGANLEIDDVFLENKTREYITDNSDKFDPEELFDTETLSEWAVNNGFVRQEKTYG